MISIFHGLKYRGKIMNNILWNLSKRPCEAQAFNKCVQSGLQRGLSTLLAFKAIDQDFWHWLSLLVCLEQMFVYNMDHKHLHYQKPIFFSQTFELKFD